MLWVLVILTIFFSIALSQDGKLTEKEINLVRNNARKALGVVAHREKMISVLTDDKLKVTQTYGFSKEFLPPDRNHFMLEYRTPTEVLRSESVFIGAKGYSKVGKEHWKLDPNAGRESGLDTLADWNLDSSEVSSQTVAVVHRPTEFIGKLVTDFYEITTRQEFEKGNKSNENVYVSRYWFDKKGRIVKAERESTSTNSKSLIRRTSMYEYDESITIEAPIN